MRYAIVSDIHANLPAWKAVLLDLTSAGADHVICLGDVTGYGPEPAETLESVYASVRHFVMGNHDAALCGIISTDCFTDRARILVDWTRERLSAEALRVFREWPLTLKGQDFRCAHGDFSAPAHFRYVIEPDDAQACWETVAEPLLFVGHSHAPGLFVRGASGTPRRVAPQDFVREPGKRYLVNVGSVGQSRDGDPRASYCIWDTGKQTVLWRRVPFDLDAYRAAMDRVGLPRESSPVLQADPLAGAQPIRPMLGFHPPVSPDQSARRARPMRELATVRRRLAAWRTAALVLLVAGLAAIGMRLLAQRRAAQDMPVRIAGRDPLPRVASHYPAEDNLIALPDPRSPESLFLPGWDIHLGNGRQQSAVCRKDDTGQTILRLRSGGTGRALVLQSSEIQGEPRQRFAVEAYFRKAESFRGRIALRVAVDRQTENGKETLEQYLVKEPNLPRKGGWMAARETFELPAGATRLRVFIEGDFKGEVEIGQLSLRRRASGGS